MNFRMSHFLFKLASLDLELESKFGSNPVLSVLSEVIKSHDSRVKMNLSSESDRSSVFHSVDFCHSLKV